MIAPVDNDMAVYQHIIDPVGELLGTRESSPVDYAIWIEYDDVGPGAFAEKSTILKTQPLGRE